ncbi:MAG: VWA-like domain-containing protein [Megasphaera sp.]|jgi:predicted metal-dependent peptidase|uniref:vWA domain-containing protein n=1 Tax=Megasphaera sueciensis TaxID=349094 RepID=UPI003CFD80D4|nr:VWA-like domain-containing protein [Megasphaera sp.]MCI1822343.1 VWA-like domain-containing protein [Megasphaera sp.]
MENYFISEASLLYQRTYSFIDDYQKKQSDHTSASIIVPVDYKKEFFNFIDKVNVKLMEDKDNFYGYFLFQMTRKIRFDISSPTAVNFKNAKYVIYFNPLIFLTLTPDQMETTIKHEILHIVSLHLLRARDLRNNYSKLALNMSMDIVVNTYLTHLPPDAVTLQWINMTYSLFLLPFESFEYYADNIQTALDSLTKTKNIPDTDSKTNEKIKTKYDPKTTHDIWNDSDELDNQTLKKFTEKYIDASQKGMIPKYLESMIASLKKSLYELPWNLYLKKMMGSITCDRKKTTTRRNRRQPERLDLPGHLKNHKAKIIIAIDISGSISDGEFKQAMQEVLRIVQNYNHEITIVECDDEIRRTYVVKTIHDLKERINVRGGTKFSPVFEYANTKKIDLLVYFTDGLGENELLIPPEKYKTLWVLSGKGDHLSLKNSYGIIKKLSPLKTEDEILDFDDVEKGGYSMNNQESISMQFD